MMRILVRAWLIELGYLIKPYDMLADRRHWRWQKPMRCGLPPMPPEVRAEVMAAIARKVGPIDQGCRVPPPGWWCSRTPGHDGPCAARPAEERNDG